MIHPLSIGSQVIITGPSLSGATHRMGDNFVIDEIVERPDGKSYTCDKFGRYPASSLRLVEELEIGDRVEVIGPAASCGYDQDLGKIFQITEKSGEMFCTLGYAWYFPESLRKLTPEEIQLHHEPTGWPQIEWVRKTDKRLSAIEKRLDVNADTFALMRQELTGMQKSIAVLEGIQRGEEPEVCEGISRCLMEATRKAYNCKPNAEPIHITFTHGNTTSTWNGTCPSDGLTWCEKALDGMREG